jgi:NAD(P)-dependent dehydrogenase (short-subunit alcohol dehydrogenase family)
MKGRVYSIARHLLAIQIRSGVACNYGSFRKQSNVGSDFEKQVEAETTLGRFGQPEDIARVAVFLASEDAAWLTGERMAASGVWR